MDAKHPEISAKSAELARNFQFKVQWLPLADNAIAESTTGCGC
jgi:hypothetical protein